MKFNETAISVTTKVNKDGGEQTTKLTLTASDIPDEVVQSALISGQSPRVRIQNKWRSDGIPKEVTMSWEQYVVPGRAPRIHMAETPESIAAKAKADPAYLTALLEQLGLTTEEPSE